MAGTEVTDLLLRIRGDTSDAESKIGSAGGKLTELNQAAELAMKGFGLLEGAARRLYDVIEHGQSVVELSQSFATLQKQAGSLASTELVQLREATQGLVSDTNLMRAANEALLSGLSPKQFEDLAKAADTLGDAVGVNTTDALNQLTLAANTGQERLLKMYGIVVDNKRAEEDFAKTLGTTADHLNELGKKEAARLAIIEKIKEKSEELAGATAGGPGTIADALTQAANAAGTFYDKFSAFVNDSPRIATAIKQATQQLTDLGNALTGTGKASIEAQIRLKEQGLKELENPDLFEKLTLAGVGAFKGQSGGEAQAAAIAKTKEALKELNAERDKLADDEVRKQLEAELAVWQPEGVEIENNRKKFLENTKGRKEATDETKKLIAAQNELKQSLQQLNDANALRPLSDALNKAFTDDFSPDKAQAAFGAFIQKFREATDAELRLKYAPELNNATTKATTEGLIKGFEDGKVAAELYQFNQRLEEANKQAFQNSVSFFADLMSSALDGTADNFEQLFTDAAKKIAVGFASQMAANLAQSLGLGNIGSLGSAQGLGQAIAAQFGFTGGGVKPLSDLFGSSGPAAALTASAGALDTSAGLLSAAAEALSAVAGGQGIGGLLGAAGGLGSLTGGASAATGAGGILEAAAGVATGAGTTGGLGTLLGTSLSGGAVIIGVGAGAALLANGVKTGGLSGGLQGGIGGGLLGGALGGGLGAGLLGPIGLAAGLFGGDLFGGDSKLAQERKDREALLDQLKEQFGGLSFQTVGGKGTLDAKNFNVSGSPLAGQGASFGQTFAELITGDNGKLSDDLAGIFENAVDGAKNFNEQLVNVQSAFNKFGIDAGKAKGDIQNLFLDGKISLDEFGTGLSNLNLIQQDVFTGPDGIQQGVEIMAESINDSPRVALQALADEFNTLNAAGLTTTSQISDYFTGNMQPALAGVFQELDKLGVKSFDDVANAIAQNPDLVFAIVNAMQALTTASGAAANSVARLGSTTTSAASNGSGAVKRLAGDYKDLSRNIDDAIRKTKDLNAINPRGGQGGAASGASDESDGLSDFGA